MFRLRAAGDVEMTVLFCVDGIKIATSGVAKVVLSTVNQTFPAKRLRKVEWYRGSEYKQKRPGERYIGNFTDPVRSECAKSF